MVKSKTGERGIFNRWGARFQFPERRLKFLKKEFGSIDAGLEFMGTNPCGEIVLRSKQFCNLTEVIARKEDTEKDLLEKARLAAILGTYQASLTNFKYISKEWKENVEKEALLGVSITGQWDSPVVRDPKVLRKMREVVVETNKK